ncbi:hypothetical protein AAL_06546 [Moelleriella libera RCEF 2490]|uniref:Uncharacterized protein n=1 Tax=Moelleriella libera RCEF 2490 TaxID=1081109 RepID=A0A167YV13_9HYPO|nr:hypothetical protein AAL_06546 [Moelleriella libera RCEF 2490]
MVPGGSKGSRRTRRPSVDPASLPAKEAPATTTRRGSHTLARDSLQKNVVGSVFSRKSSVALSGPDTSTAQSSSALASSERDSFVSMVDETFFGHDDSNAYKINSKMTLRWAPPRRDSSTAGPEHHWVRKMEKEDEEEEEEEERKEDHGPRPITITILHPHRGSSTRCAPFCIPQLPPRGRRGVLGLVSDNDPLNL